MNKHAIGDVVDYLGTVCNVIDLRFDKTNKVFVYDIKEKNGDGEYNDIEEDYLTANY